MAVADPPLGASLHHRRAWVILMLALFFGLVSLAVVATAVPSISEPKVECHEQYLTADDGVTPLTADDGATLLTTGLPECQAEPADHWVAIPGWGRAIWRLLLR